MIHPIKSKRKLKIYRVTATNGCFLIPGDEFTIAGDFESVTLWQVLKDCFAIGVGFFSLRGRAYDQNKTGDGVAQDSRN